MPFVRTYIESRTDVEWRTIRNLKTTEDKLNSYFGADKLLSTITPADAEEFKRWLGEQLTSAGDPFSTATVAGHIKRAKQFFRYAVKKKLIEENPFVDVKAGSQASDERKFYVDLETIQKVIDAAPDAQWRLIISLCRFAGLRCPSEVLHLKWSVINWEQGRFIATAPKTRKQGKPTRVVPIFPELRPYLEEAFGQAEDGDEFCITRYRSQDTNSRTQFERILANAAVKLGPGCCRICGHRARPTSRTISVACRYCVTRQYAQGGREALYSSDRGPLLSLR